MKILIYGAGVIGCTYGWQLVQVGCEVTLKVREGETEYLEQKGIQLNCLDFRQNQKTEYNIIFTPKIIDSLQSNNDYEYIIVTTNSSYLKSILADLNKMQEMFTYCFFRIFGMILI